MIRYTSDETFIPTKGRSHFVLSERFTRKASICKMMDNNSDRITQIAVDRRGGYLLDGSKEVRKWRVLT
jgi:hypothetical protein